MTDIDTVISAPPFENRPMCVVWPTTDLRVWYRNYEELGMHDFSSFFFCRDQALIIRTCGTVFSILV